MVRLVIWDVIGLIMTSLYWWPASHQYIYWLRHRNKYLFCNHKPSCMKYIWNVQTFYEINYTANKIANIDVKKIGMERKIFEYFRLNQTLFDSVYCSYGAEIYVCFSMMTSSNGNIFRVTSALCREVSGHRWIPRTKASDVEVWFDVFFDLRLNKRLGKQSWGSWFETPPRPLW